MRGVLDDPGSLPAVENLKEQQSEFYSELVKQFTKLSVIIQRHSKPLYDSRIEEILKKHN